MKCSVYKCENRATYVKKASGLELYDSWYCDEHAPVGSYNMTNVLMSCGHPITSLEGPNDGRPGTFYCADCAEEADNEQGN